MFKHANIGKHRYTKYTYNKMYYNNINPNQTDKLKCIVILNNLMN